MHPGTEARTHPLQPCWEHNQEHRRASDSDSDAQREQVHRCHVWPPGVWFQRRPQKARRKGPSLPAGVGACPGSHSTARPPQVAQDKAPRRERQLAPPSPLLNRSESIVFSQSLALGLELRSRDKGLLAGRWGHSAGRRQGMVFQLAGQPTKAAFSLLQGQGLGSCSNMSVSCP